MNAGQDVAGSLRDIRTFELVVLCHWNFPKPQEWGLLEQTTLRVCGTLTVTVEVEVDHGCRVKSEDRPPLLLAPPLPPGLPQTLLLPSSPQGVVEVHKRRKLILSCGHEIKLGREIGRFARQHIQIGLLAFFVKCLGETDGILCG